MQLIIDVVRASFTQCNTMQLVENSGAINKGGNKLLTSQITQLCQHFVKNLLDGSSCSKVSIPETACSLSGLLKGLSLGVEAALAIMGNRVPARAVSTSDVMNTGMKSQKKGSRKSNHHNHENLQQKETHFKLQGHCHKLEQNNQYYCFGKFL